MKPGPDTQRIPFSADALLGWWRPLRRRPVAWFLSLLLPAAGFAALILLVRVKVGGPQFEMERRGSLLYLRSVGDGAIWAARAREAGPEIQRYDLAKWTGYEGIERSLADAFSPVLPPYEPRLRPLPESGEPPLLELAAKGAAVLPPPPAPPEIQPAAPWRQVPALFPLAPLGACTLPAELPPLPAGAPPALPADGARFLLRLAADGSVSDSVALSKDEGGNKALEAWFRGIRFDPALAAAGEWFAVGLTYHNLSDVGDHDS